MFDPSTPLATEKVEAQAVRLRVNRLQKARPHLDPECRINFAFKDRILHALPVIFADPRHTTQPLGPALGRHCHVICDENQHRLPPNPGRIAVYVAPQMPREKLGLYVRNQPQRKPLGQPGVAQLDSLAVVVGLQDDPASPL